MPRFTMQQVKTFALLMMLAGLVVAGLSIIFTWACHYFIIPVQYHGLPLPHGDLPPFPGSTSENIWWFVQISDIHITSEPSQVKATRLSDFREFCHEHLTVIQPTLVLATGDLTDGAPNSSQNKRDWMSYQKVLLEANLPYSLIWLDVRGNHDNFNVPNPDHPKNLFRQYSVLGEVGDSSFLYELQLPFGTYSFIYIDAILKMGLKRPINFFGILDEMDLFQLKMLTERVQQTPSNHTIYFGHYPTSSLLAPSGLEEIISNGIVYLCGHYHDLDIKEGIKKMYALQRHGSLELELEDWRRHRMYRVVAFDHDILSFIDVAFGNWPVILITNPKSALSLVPGHEPIRKMIHSSHIRFLIFSPAKIAYAKVAIDDRMIGMAKAVGNGPLYVMPWVSSRFSRGLHVITVKARDVSGRVQTVSHKFSLDESRPNQPFWSAFVIMINGLLFFALCIFGLECVCVVPLAFFRRYTEPTCLGAVSTPLLYGFLLLVHTDGLYHCLVAIALYPLIGPWLIGQMLEDSYGVLTLYGVYINGAFVGDKYAMYFFAQDLLLFHIPLTLFCILHLSRAHNHAGPHSRRHDNQRSSSRRVVDVVRLLISLFLLKPVLQRSYKTTWSMGHWYGYTAFVLSPKYTWTFVVGLYVACRSVYIGCRGKNAEAEDNVPAVSQRSGK